MRDTFIEKAEELRGRYRHAVDAVPTDAELRRLREHAVALSFLLCDEQAWRQHSQHIITIVDRLVARKAKL